MLKAVDTDLVFTISLKRSTQNLQLSTNSPADYPIFGSCVDGAALARTFLRAAALVGGEAAGHNALRGSGPNR